MNDSRGRGRCRTAQRREKCLSSCKPSRNLISLPARGTLRSVRSLAPVLACCFPFNPFTNIGRAIFELNSIGFATGQKLYGVTIQERYVFQVKGEMVALAFQIEQSLQLSDVLGLDTAAEGKDHFAVCRSLDSQHTCRRCTSISG